MNSTPLIRKQSRTTLSRQPSLNGLINSSLNSQNSLTKEKSFISTETKNPVRYAKALYDYKAEANDELSFEEGDLISIIDDSSTEFLYGQISSLRGRVPRIHVNAMSPEVADELSESTLLTATNPDGDKDKEGFFKKLFTKSASVKRLSPSKSRKIPNGESDDDDSPLARHPADEKGRRLSLTIGANPRLTASGINTTSSTPTLLEVDEGESSRKSADKQSRRSSLNPGNMISKSKDDLKSLIGASSTGGSPPPTSSGTKAPSSPTTNGPVIAMNFAATKELWVDVMGSKAVKALGYSKQAISRQEVIYEIVSTERDYISDLEYVIEVYIRALQKNKLIRPKDVAVIFGNIESLIETNKMILAMLEEHVEDDNVSGDVGAVFVQMV
jgi:hypothetical protein